MEDSQVKHLFSLTQRPVNRIFWAPQNGFVVLAGLGSLNGQLEFYNVNEQVSIFFSTRLVLVNNQNRRA